MCVEGINSVIKSSSEIRKSSDVVETTGEPICICYIECCGIVATVGHRLSKERKT